MLVEQTSQSTITIEVTPTGLPLDESLAAIKHFLSTRVAERTAQGLRTAPAPILIDIGFLGIADDAAPQPEYWNDRILYPIRVHFSSILLGPCYVAGHDGPCPRCLERRWIANRSLEEQRAWRIAQQVLASGDLPTVHDAALESIWAVVEADLCRGDPLRSSEDGRAWFYALRLDSLQMQRHQLIADSSCPVCARPAPDEADGEAYQLSARPKRGITTYRLVDPLDYALSEERYVSSMCGMLGTAAIVDLAHTVTAPVTSEYFMRGKRSINPVGWGGHSTKFRTSRRIGVLEALERYSGHWPRTRNPAIIDSYQNLYPHALDPATCGLYHPDTYTSSQKLKPFTPESKIAWVWGYSFRHTRPILVPEQLAYYFPQTDGTPRFVNDTSNGCAIGSCLEEGMLFGLLELVERDNFLIHWYAKLAAPRIDPWSVRSIKTLRLLDRIERAGYDLSLLDTRLDLPFPTVTAVAIRRDDGLGKLALAAGAGLEPEDAIRAAVCELAAYIPSLPDRVKAKLEHLQSLAADQTKVASIEHHILLYGLPEMAHHAAFLLQNPCLRSVEETYEQWNTRRPPNQDLRADLQFSIDSVIDLDMDVIAVDQTAPELQDTGLKVMRVIIPGLVPIDFGWGHHRIFNLSRMRTVLCATGHQNANVDLTAVNPTPHPFP